MNLNTLLCLIVSFFCIDYYESVLLPRKALAWLGTKGAVWQVYLSVKQVLRRKYFELFVLSAYCFYALFFNKEALMLSLALGMYLMLSPFLAYHRYFMYIKYSFFLLLILSSLVLPLLALLGLTGLVFYFLFCLKCLSIDPYHDKDPRTKWFKNSSLLITLLSLISLVRFRERIIPYPLEQFAVFYLMIITSQLDTRYQDHKLYLLRCQKRYYLSLIHLSQPRFDFLSQRQAFEYFKTVVLLSLVLCVLISTTSHPWDLLLVYLGILCQMFFYFDAITQHFLLKRSRVYANPVTYNLVESFMSGLVFLSIVSYSVMKISSTQIDLRTYSMTVRFCLALLFGGCLVYFVLRMRKNHRLGEGV